MILERISQDTTIEVARLANELDVSGETIRRDMKEMQRQGLVRKVHGGAVLPETFSDSSYLDRLKENADGKRRIARAIARLVEENESLIIETGTTATYIAQALRDHRCLTVVTNSVDVARSLAFRPENKVFMAGGQLTSDDGAALGSTAIEYVRRFRVKYAVFSVAGLHLQDGLTSFRVAEAEFSRVVVSRAETPILAIDSTKFGRSALVSSVELSTVTLAVTDAEPAPAFRVLFQQAGVELVIAD